MKRLIACAGTPGTSRSPLTVRRRRPQQAAVRRHAYARRYSYPVGEVGAERHRRLYPYHHLQRADSKRPRQGDRGSARQDRRQARRLCHRPAQQSGAAFWNKEAVVGIRHVPGAGAKRVVSTRGRHKEEVPKPGTPPRTATRPTWQADRRSSLLTAARPRLSGPIVARLFAGPASRNRDRHQELRQRLGADDHPGRGWGGHAPDHRALLHAVRPLDPGYRDRP